MTNKKLRRAAFGTRDTDRDPSGRFVRNEMAQPRQARGGFPLAVFIGLFAVAIAAAALYEWVPG